MAKLYWRVKKNGKWTWKPAIVLGVIDSVAHVIPIIDVPIDEEEEERRMKDITETTLEEQVQFFEDLRKKLEEEE